MKLDNYISIGALMVLAIPVPLLIKFRARIVGLTGVLYANEIGVGPPVRPTNN